MKSLNKAILRVLESYSSNDIRDLIQHDTSLTDEQKQDFLKYLDESQVLEPITYAMLDKGHSLSEILNAYETDSFVRMSENIIKEYYITDDIKEIKEEIELFIKNHSHDIAGVFEVDKIVDVAVETYENNIDIDKYIEDLGYVYVSEIDQYVMIEG